MEIQLKTTDAATGASAIILKIADDEDENPLWSEVRAPTLPGRQTQGRLDFSQFDPEVHSVWTQDSWHNGALQPYWRPEDPHRYSKSDGMDARFEGVMAMFPPLDNLHANTAGDRKDTMDIVVVSGGVESEVDTSWTAQNSSTESQPTDPYQGNLAVQYVTSGSLTTNDEIATHAAINIDGFQGQAIIVNVRMKRTAGASVGIIMKIDDGQGNTDTASSVTSGSYTEASATITVDASATTLAVSFISSGNETEANTYVIDDLTFVLALGDGPTVQFDGVPYWASGKYIFKLVSGLWTVVNTAGATVTDLIVFDGVLYAACGYSTAYEYSSNGTTWTVSTASGADNKANFWAVAKNAAGAWALWKSETATSIANATIAINSTNNWTAPLSVGDTSSNITGLYDAFDTVLVGKTDGLYEFTRFDPNSSAGDNLFSSVESTSRRFPHVDNYSRGAFFDGWFWTKTAYHGLVRYRPGNYQRVESIFAQPRIANFVPKIIDILPGPRHLWFLIGDSTSDYLISLQQTIEGRLVAHIHATLPTLRDSSSGAHQRLAIDPDNSAIYVTGMDTRSLSTNPQEFVWRFHWSPTNPAPFAEDFNRVSTSPAVTSTWETAIYHSQTPTEPKAHLALVVWGKNISSTNTILVKFGIDGAAASDKTLGTFNGSGTVQTLYFEGLTTPVADAVGKIIQLEFTHTLPAADTGTGPQIFAFGLISALRTDRLRTFSATIELTEEMFTDEGNEAPEDADSLFDSLVSMEAQDYPIRLAFYPPGTEEDEVEIDRVSVFIRDIQHQRIAGGGEQIRLLLQEAKTAA